MQRFFFIMMFFGAVLCPSFFGVGVMTAQAQPPRGEGDFPGTGNGALQPVLVVNPREIDLGSLGPGEETEGVFYLKNMGSGSVDWSTEGPEGWIRSGSQGLAGMVGEAPMPIKVQLTLLNEKGPGRLWNCSLLLRLEGGGQTVSYRREAPLGALRESIRINSRGGARTVFFNARLSELASTSLLGVEPLRIDYGAVRPGEQVTRRVQVTNRGKEPLTWKAGLPPRKRVPETELITKGRYVTFLNEAAIGAGSYPTAGQLREGLELTGPWAEEGGHPVSQADRSILRYRFTGTGISLFIKKTPEGGPFTVFLDDQFVNLLDSFSDRRERVEILIVDDQPEVSHTLSVINGGGRVVIEGVRIFGKPVLKGPAGWIHIFPNSGVTTRETDYVNIVLNANRLVPGVYGEQIFFTSNGGEANVEVFLEVATLTQTRFLDVHRYLSGSDYLFSTNPQAEASRLKGYKHLGIAFRLFSPGTPGTTDFSRWYNPTKGDHFYSPDPLGGAKPPAGYLLEGSIGNIATVRLAGTRELYRWYHPKTGAYFFTTDQTGEGLGKKGYRFDGIVGFVR